MLHFSTQAIAEKIWLEKLHSIIVDVKSFIDFASTQDIQATYSGALEMRDKVVEWVDKTKETIDEIRERADQVEQIYNDAREFYWWSWMKNRSSSGNN